MLVSKEFDRRSYDQLPLLNRGVSCDSLQWDAGLQANFRQSVNPSVRASRYEAPFPIHGGRGPFVVLKQNLTHLVRLYPVKESRVVVSCDVLQPGTRGAAGGTAVVAGAGCTHRGHLAANAVNIRRSVRTNALGFPILSDPPNEVAGAFGLHSTCPTVLLRYKRLRSDLPAVNGDRAAGCEHLASVA